MGCERSRLFATAAKLSITHTFGALPTYGFVVFLDFVYSCGTGQFDTDGKIFLEGRSEGQLSTALLLPFSCARLRQNQGKGRGSR
jgi:hypothetical protein